MNQNNAVDIELTKYVAEFVVRTKVEDLPSDVIELGKKSILDGFGLALSGSVAKSGELVRRHLDDLGLDEGAATVIGGGRKVAPRFAAFANGVGIHADDYDDTQLAVAKDRVYGLLTHPTAPALPAAFAVSELLKASGRDFMMAYHLGVEVECKIAEAINPDHYNLGFHTSGTIGTFGAAVAAAKLLGLDLAGIRAAIGGAASMAAGIRANFGTMGKPLHVGRSSENGVTAAMLVKEGFTFDDDALDGRWGYLAVAGRGGEPGLVLGRFGRPFALVSPGISVKPYPCGVLTHPSMDLMKAVMQDEALAPADIGSVTLHAANNILHPIRYRIAATELQGKFCMAFLLSAMILRGRAGKEEFTDAFVRSPEVQAMQARVHTQYDPAIDAMGQDRILSRIEVSTTDGRRLSRMSDHRYRGGPDHPLSDAELEEKFLDGARGVLPPPRSRELLDAVWRVETLRTSRTLLDLAAA